MQEMREFYSNLIRMFRLRLIRRRQTNSNTSGVSVLSVIVSFLKFVAVIVAVFIPVLIVSNAVSRYCDCKAQNEQIAASSWVVMVEDSAGNHATYQINPYSDKEISVHTDGGVIVIIGPVGSALSGSESVESGEELEGAAIIVPGDYSEESEEQNTKKS